MKSGNGEFEEFREMLPEAAHVLRGMLLGSEDTDKERISIAFKIIDVCMKNKEDGGRQAAISVNLTKAAKELAE